MQTAQPNRPFRVVLLTRGTRNAALILDALSGHHIRPDAIIFERPAGRQLIDRLRDMRRRRGLRATIGAVMRRGAALVHPSLEPWHSADFFAARTNQLIAVPSLSGSDTVAALEHLRPDLLVLAGAPILPDAVLGSATHGTLNAHPGLLPRYRGVDVVPHAVLNGDPVGATVHFVDTGIDTGGIVARIEVQPAVGDTLTTLQHRVEGAGGALLAEAVARIVRDGCLPTESQAERHPICKRLSPSGRREAEMRLRSRA